MPISRVKQRDLKIHSIIVTRPKKNKQRQTSWEAENSLHCNKPSSTNTAGQSCKQRDREGQCRGGGCVQRSRPQYWKHLFVYIWLEKYACVCPKPHVTHTWVAGNLTSDGKGAQQPHGWQIQSSSFYPGRKGNLLTAPPSKVAKEALIVSDSGHSCSMNYPGCNGLAAANTHKLQKSLSSESHPHSL